MFRTFFEISIQLTEYDITISVQGRVFTGELYDKQCFAMCGGVINGAYHDLLDMPLSRWLQLWERWVSYRAEVNEAEKKALKKHR